jgi:hypothetical protein
MVNVEVARVMYVGFCYFLYGPASIRANIYQPGGGVDPSDMPQ